MEKERPVKYYSHNRLVSHYARRHGFGEDQVFHSPIEMQVALPFFLAIGGGGLFVLIEFWDWAVWILKWSIVPWYLLIGLLNNCFIVGEQEFVMLNRNIPWWWTRKLTYSKIRSVKIRKSYWFSWLLMPLLILGEGIYVQVKTVDGSVRRYYCWGLEGENHDGNDTRHIIDDLYIALLAKGVNVTMEGIY